CTRFLCAGLFFFTSTLVTQTAVQAASATDNYPNRPIRLILPHSPGGPTDLIGRFTAQKLGESLGQTVVADNRAGAAGSVGCEIAAKSAPDGYTLLLGAPGCLAANVSLYPKLGYDPMSDFEAITPLTSRPELLIVDLSVSAP